MFNKSPLRWKLYFLIYFPLAGGNMLSVVSSDSALYTYYHVLITFNEGYRFSYYFNWASALMGILTLLPLLLFILRIRAGSAWLWQYFFYAKSIFDLLGHSYEIKFIKSLFYNTPGSVAFAILVSLALIAPSYLACFQYAFRQNKLFADQ